MDGHQHGDTVVVDDKDPHFRRRQAAPARERIPGWGADLDPANRPAVPMERTPPRLEHWHAERPAEQPHRGIEVLHSVERPGLTPVYGTTSPPRGLSGMIRRLAFRYSENDMRHWMVLLLADRVDVGEGILEDLAHGHVPNLWKEMGLQSEWKHNRVGLMRKTVVAGAVVGVAVWALSRRRRRD